MKKKPRRHAHRTKPRPAATAAQITDWMESIPELEWSDFDEISPDRWELSDASKSKMVWLYDQLTVRMAECEAYAEQAQRDLEEMHQRWVTPPLVK